ncbi:hypothetical protein, partial [Candidatus Fukatsuia symbiotica]|uniref:hypothetical protein n=1 Tax=Candidatus Fukatsuia symbiotica TaxID=1878942 RepID=UPI0013C426AF
VMALTMLGFEGNFLVSSQLYFHGYEHDPYRLQNQASSLITGICCILSSRRSPNNIDGDHSITPYVSIVVAC